MSQPILIGFALVLHGGEAAAWGNQAGFSGLLAISALVRL